MNFDFMWRSNGEKRYKAVKIERKIESRNYILGSPRKLCVNLR